MSLFDVTFEGPPSVDDMDSLVRDLLWDGKLEAAHAVAETMLEHWQHSDAFDSSKQFYYWLGIRTPIGALLGAKRNRAYRRELGLARRPAKRARTKPAALPVSRRPA